MSTKSMNLNIRVNPDIKAKADPILEKMGLTATQLYNILLSQVAITKSVPFPIVAEKESVTTPEQDRMIWAGIQKSRAERKAGVKGYTVEKARKITHKRITEVANNG